VTSIAYGNSVNGTASCKTYYSDTSTCILDNEDACEITEFACDNGYHDKEGLNLTRLLNNATRTGLISLYKGNLRELRTNSQEEKKGSEYYGISGDINWGVDYGDKGIINGKTRCDTEPDKYGFYACYCKITGYKANNEQNFQTLNSDDWVYADDGDGWYQAGYNECVQNCATVCAGMLGGNQSNYRKIRAEILSAVTIIPRSCEANTITINWSDAAQTDIDANNAGTATYGEDVRTPVKAATKKGKTFKGWRFSAPEQTTTGNNG
jgi:hypothetical protein